ncbi:MAG: deoxyribose-phosphate aldolase [Austwickia sp.]|jgi:deoxyribose-phosphate aldolase|nr:MAG: deoxyribose-phosphate aldolase [Austwickia sp.]
MTRIAPGTTLTVQQIADLVDHALLKPDLTPHEVAAGVDEVAAQQAWSVCVRPSDVADAARRLADAHTKVCTVIGFPHGTTSTAAKVAEARQALADGAVELDMVLNIGRLRGGQFQAVRDDIAAVVEVGHAGGALVKVIFETALLDQGEKVDACRAATEAGADFVKTSTGFAGGGATVPDVLLMAANVPDRVSVKASGGVRDIEIALAMVAAGATRIGTSSTVAIVEGARRLAQAGGIVVPQPDRDLEAAQGY